MDISNNNNLIILDGSSSADTISNGGANVTINAGTGPDLISNTGANVIINGDAGRDSINNTAANVTIVGGACNDSISLSSAASGTFIKYSSGDGDDTLYGVDSNDTLQITGAKYSTVASGNDLIISVGGGSVILKNAQNISLNIDGTLTGGEENTLPEGWTFDSTKKKITVTLRNAEYEIDLNESYGAGVEIVDASKTLGIEIYGNVLDNSIKGGKGDDTIAGGDGNDTVSLGAGADVYIYQGGDDVIQDYVSGIDSIQVDSAEMEFYSVETVGANVIIETSKGNLTILKGVGKDIKLMDFYPPICCALPYPKGWKIDSTGSRLTATMTTADDIDLINDYYAYYNEDIRVVDASKTTSGIEIIGNDNNISIRGGRGADTISGGDGDDTVSLGAGADIYIYQGGNDVIQDYTAVDSIQIDTLSVDVTGVETIGTNVIYKTSEGNLTIKRGVNKEISLLDADGEEIILKQPLPDGWKYNTKKTAITANATTADNIDLNEEYGADIIRVNASKLTSGVQIIGNDWGTSIKGGSGNDTIYGGEGNDTVSLGAGADVYIYQGGDDIVQDYSTADTIQIYSEKIKIAGVETVGSNVIYSTDAGYITVKGGSGKKIILIDANGEEIILEQPLPDGWKYNSKKTAITATATTAGNIDLTEEYGSDVTKVNASKLTKGVQIVSNVLDNSIKGGKGADTIYGGDGDDTISLGAGADIYIYNGGYDVIQDYTAGQDSIKIDTSKIEIEDAEYEGNNFILVTNYGNLKIKNGCFKQIVLTDLNGNKIDYSGKFPEGWKYDGAKNLLQATIASADNKIDLTEVYGEGIETVDASKITGGVQIVGNDLDTSIKGGKGADTIIGGAGNDTVSLGGGADVYIYNGGDDVIQDYTAGADSIQIDTNYIEIQAVETIGADVVYFTTEGNLTVTKGGNKKISLMDKNGEKISVAPEIPEGWKYDGAKNLLQATIASADNKIDLYEDYGKEIETIDASKVTKGVEIYGNVLDNSIKGGSGADTIYGGDGDDTISLGGGNDIYIYSGGDDIILDYSTADEIQIDTYDIAVKGVETVGNDITYKTSEGTITIKNGKGKTLNINDGNGVAIGISNASKNVAETVWFLEDDNNFVASDIDSVTENKFAVTDIQPQNYSTLAQDSTLLTFAKEK